MSSKKNKTDYRKIAVRVLCGFVAAMLCLVTILAAVHGL